MNQFKKKMGLGFLIFLMCLAQLAAMDVSMAQAEARNGITVERDQSEIVTDGAGKADVGPMSVRSQQYRAARRP